LIEPVGPASDGVRLALHVQPGASRTELAGRHGNSLKVRVAAPPVDGAANDELVRFLAAVLGVTRSSVTVLSGLSARKKGVLVRGISVAEARRKLRL